MITIARPKPRYRMGRLIAAPAMLIAALLTSLAVAAPASAVSTASDVGIYVYCASSSIKPVGMWYSADDGQQGWANWKGSTDIYGGQWFTFHLNSTITNVNVSIGCGGTPQKWGKVMSGVVAVFKIPSQNFNGDCSGSGYTCRMTYR